MTKTQKDALYARLGKELLRQTIGHSDVEMPEIEALFGNTGEKFTSKIEGSFELRQVRSILEEAGVDDEELFELAKEFLPGKLAKLMGAKQVVVTW